MLQSKKTPAKREKSGSYANKNGKRGERTDRERLKNRMARSSDVPQLC